MAKDHYEKAITKGVNIGNTKRDNSTAQLRKDGTWTHSVAKVSEPKILFSLSAFEGPHTKFGTTERDEETKAKHTQKRIEQEGAVPLQLPGHGVTGDGANDAHRTSLFQQSSLFS